MTNQAVPFKELMEEVLNLLKSKGYMESTLTIYRRTYTRIQVFLSQCGTDVYKPELGERFLAGTNVKKTTFVAYACAIRRLNDFNDGTLRFSPSSLLKKEHFSEILLKRFFKNIKKVPKSPTKSRLLGTNGGGCRIRTRVDITALMVFKTTPL